MMSGMRAVFSLGGFFSWKWRLALFGLLSQPIQLSQFSLANSDQG